MANPSVMREQNGSIRMQNYPNAKSEFPVGDRLMSEAREEVSPHKIPDDDEDEEDELEKERRLKEEIRRVEEELEKKEGNIQKVERDLND